MKFRLGLQNLAKPSLHLEVKMLVWYLGKSQDANTCWKMLTAFYYRGKPKAGLLQPSEEIPLNSEHGQLALKKSGVTC